MDGSGTDTSEGQSLGPARPARVQGPARSGRRDLLWVWLPVLAWAALIFVLSSIPSLGTGLGTWDLALRKVAHVGEYAVLALLLRRALSAPASFLLAVAYAISDEVHQTFVTGREGHARDVALDALGAVLGLLAFAAWRRRR